MRPLPLIYATRHGQTDWNAEERLQGQRDIPLNALGRSQATGNGRALARLVGTGAAWEGFDFVASPLARTRETMERLRAELGLEPGAYRTEDRLKEVHFGDWQGSTYAELRAAGAGARIAEREADKWRFRPPGDEAESYADLAERVGAWLGTVEGPTMTVIHGGVIRTLLHLVGGMDGDEATHADTPQDRVLRIEGRTIEWLEGAA